jgi:polyisoprenoid-binding protein YceI
MRSKPWVGVVIAIGCLGSAAAAPVVVTIEPERTHVSFVLGATLHDVHGSLRVERGEITYDPETGVASGEVVLDATSAETGSSKRDKKMHNKVLESAGFPEIVFRPTSAAGAIDDSGSSEIDIEGVVEIHGGEHPVTLHAVVTRDGNAVHGDAAIDIPYVDWGMEDPSVFLLTVGSEVRVELAVEGTVAP